MESAPPIPSTVRVAQVWCHNCNTIALAEFRNDEYECNTCHGSFVEELDQGVELFNPAALVPVRGSSNAGQGRSQPTSQDYSTLGRERSRSENDTIRADADAGAGISANRATAGVSTGSSNPIMDYVQTFLRDVVDRPTATDGSEAQSFAASSGEGSSNGPVSSSNSNNNGRNASLDGTSETDTATRTQQEHGGGNGLEALAGLLVLLGADPLHVSVNTMNPIISTQTTPQGSVSTIQIMGSPAMRLAAGLPAAGPGFGVGGGRAGDGTASLLNILNLLRGDGGGMEGMSGLAGLLRGGGMGGLGGFSSGDALSQQQFEQFLHHLFMNEGSSSGPAPASQGVIEGLPRRNITAEMSETDRTALGECPIAQEPYEVGDVMVALPCGHNFKEESIVHWLQMHNACPVCRVSINSASSEAEENVNAGVVDGGGTQSDSS